MQRQGVFRPLVGTVRNLFSCRSNPGCAPRLIALVFPVNGIEGSACGVFAETCAYLAVLRALWPGKYSWPTGLS